MKRYLFTAQVKSASGYQTFFVDAETREEADALINEGGDIYAHEVDVTDLERLEFDHETTTDDFGDFPPEPAAADDALTAADYEEVLTDHRRLVRELDVLINGENAAQQASLCDIVGQVRSECLKAAPATPGAWSDVVAERQRQIEKGYTAEHDDEHVCDEIAAMAAYYIMPEACRDWPTEETGYGDTLGKAIIPEGWPAPESPRWRRDDLIRGIAMAVAEVERLDRAETAPGGEDA